MDIIEIGNLDPATAVSDTDILPISQGSGTSDTKGAPLSLLKAWIMTFVNALIATIPAGPQGQAGPAGPAGVPGSIGVAGPVGARGLTGLTGAQGPAGPIGIQGITGATGASGPQGLQGVQGIQGPEGPAGPQGLQGVAGSIIVAGASTNLDSGTVDPTTEGNDGDFYINTTTDILFGPKAGGVWPAVGVVLTGPAGPQGPGGAAGAAGAAGPIGPAGPVGAAGGIGPQGPAGAQGAAGTNGTNGTNGASAYQAWLDAGNVGSEAVFVASLIGPAGPAGPAGAVGPQGPIGTQGPTGLTGAVGPAGPVGAAGPVGPAGANGTNGAVGPQGPAGAVGAGPQGPAGGGTPGGADKQIQFNNGGNLAGTSKFTFTISSGVLNLNNASFYVGTGAISASAIMQLDSTTQGFLIPRMTAAQRAAIAAPAVGLKVYQTDAGTTGEGEYVYKSTGWVSSNTGIAGANTQILFNSGGALGASPNFTWINGSNALVVATVYIGFGGGLTTSAGQNVAIGDATTLKNVTTATQMVAIGSGAGSQVTTLSYGTLIGINAGYFLTVGQQVDIIGYGAGFNLTQANHVVIIGANGASTTTTGNLTQTTNCVYIGGYVKALADNPTNEMVIGYQGIGLGSNTLVIGNSNITISALYGTLLIGTTTNVASAQLVVSSTTKGALLPQMSTTQRNAISAPAEGLEIYNLTTHKKNVYTGSAWEQVTSA